MSRLGTLLRILMTAPLAPAEDWPNYGNDKGGTRYSPLNLINRSNVRELRSAWTFHTGDLSPVGSNSMQCNPIVVDGVMYVSSSRLKVFALKDWTRLTARNGYPGVKPPWGTLSGIDLAAGTIKWQVPLGEHPELTANGVPVTGTENIGGGIVTAGGLLFIASTRDEKFRANDKTTGQVLWEFQLPAGGSALPATHTVNGKQYVAIAAGGVGKFETRPGDGYFVFALPSGVTPGTQQ